MKKYVFCLVVFSLFFININFLNADCENLIKESENVKVLKVERFPDPKTSENPYDSFIGLSISGLSESLYAVISNDFNDTKVTVKFSDLVDGKYDYPSPNINRVVNYVVSIYSSDEGCSGDTLKNFKVKTEVFNEYYYSTLCQNNPDLDLCKPMLDNSEILPSEFEKKIEDAIAYRDRTTMQKLWDFVKSYYLFALVPFLIISIIFIVRIIILKRGKKDE